MEGQFCTNCGSPAAPLPNVAPPQPQPQPQYAPVEPAPQPYGYQNQQNYCNPQQAPNPAPVYNNVTVTQPDTSTSVGGWIGWMILLTFLPLIGLIIMLACSNDKSAKNFAKAQLVIIGIFLALTLIGIIIMLLLGVGSIGAIMSSLD